MNVIPFSYKTVQKCMNNEGNVLVITRMKVSSLNAQSIFQQQKIMQSNWGKV